MRGYLEKKVAASVQRTEINGRRDLLHCSRNTSLSAKVGTKIRQPVGVV
jgi:hypothetical protein